MSGSPRYDLLLIDGSWLIFRAYHALPAIFKTPGGEAVHAVYGFTRMLRKMLGEWSPPRVAVVFDSEGPTFREEAFAEYKGDRPEVPADLPPQFAWARRVVGAYGVQALQQEGVEADDIIGTLATQGAAAGLRVGIVSGDKDFCQLIGERVVVEDTMRDVVWDRAFVEAKWGVPPERFIDLLALMGDKVDSIPGVPGIGAKTAAKLLMAHGSLEGIYGALGSLSAKQAARFEEHREQALLSQRLATIVRDLELGVTLDALRPLEADPSVQASLFLELGFASMASAAGA